MSNYGSLKDQSIRISVENQQRAFEVVKAWALGYSSWIEESEISDFIDLLGAFGYLATTDPDGHIIKLQYSSASFGDEDALLRQIAAYVDDGGWLRFLDEYDTYLYVFTDGQLFYGQEAESILALFNRSKPRTGEQTYGIYALVPLFFEVDAPSEATAQEQLLQALHGRGLLIQGHSKGHIEGRLNKDGEVKIQSMKVKE